MFKRAKKDKDYVGLENSPTVSAIIQAKTIPEKTKIRVLNWYIFTFSFLLLSEIGCDNFLNSKTEPLNKSLALSIIFNLKHSLEIVMKTIHCNIYGNNISETHDVQDLIDKLKGKIEKNKKLKNIKKQEIKNQLNKFEKYLIKYCELRLFNNAFKTAITLNDKNNILFKYPEANGNLFINIDYSILTNKVTKSDIKSIKKDILEIREILNELKNIIKDQ